jgi:hypothetical protein
MALQVGLAVAHLLILLELPAALVVLERQVKEILAV